MEFKYRSVAEFLKAEGEEETFSCLKTGWKQKQYRKMQNAKQQLILEIAKNDPRFKESILAEAKKRSA